MPTDAGYVEAQVADAVTTVRRFDQRVPEVAIVLGSGLDETSGTLADVRALPYASIPGFPRSSVAGHKGELAIAQWSGRTVLVFHGRPHFYEGYDPLSTAFTVRLAHGLGCRGVVLTNMAGGLDPGIGIGDIVVVTDHICFPALSGFNPLRGIDGGNDRFVDMGKAYDPELIAIAERVAASGGIPLSRGFYAMVSGPSYETPAEMRLLRALGATTVGMSTSFETIVARYLGMRVVCFSCVANMATDVQEHAISHDDVVVAARAVAGKLSLLISGLLADWP